MCQRGNCPFSNLETGMAEKSSPGTSQTDGKNLVWFGEIERKLRKLAKPNYRCLPLLTVSFFFLIILWIKVIKKKHSLETMWIVDTIFKERKC